MDSLLEKPASRTGKCSLTLSIDGRTYRLRPAPPLCAEARLGTSRSLPVSPALA